MNLQEDFCSQELYELLINKGFEVNCYDAPFTQRLITHQSAMKWLREKGIYLNVRIALNRMEDDVINDIHWVVDILDFNNGEWEDNNIWADTYEEAVEQSIKYVLEKLI